MPKVCASHPPHRPGRSKHLFLRAVPKEQRLKARAPHACVSGQLAGRRQRFTKLELLPWFLYTFCTMLDHVAPKINKWPFLAGDALLVCTAVFIYSQSALPMTTVHLCLVAACIGLGAIIAIVPFVLEYQGVVKLAESDALGGVIAQVQNIEKVAEQIGGATARWQTAQDAADKTMNAAKGIAERMAAEVKSFTEFMQRMNEGEKNTMRLEVEKLRRGEQDWLQVLVRMLDHVHALHAGAVRSGQPNLIEQLNHFQNACREAARRVGLVPFSASPAEPFDPERHQAFESDGKPAAGAVITDMVATGYTFQGRLLRPVLVRLKNGASPVPAKAVPSAAQLSLAGTEDSGVEAGKSKPAP